MGNASPKTKVEQGNLVLARVGRVLSRPGAAIQILDVELSATAKRGLATGVKQIKPVPEPAPTPEPAPASELTPA